MNADFFARLWAAAGREGGETRIKDFWDHTPAKDEAVGGYLSVLSGLTLPNDAEREALAAALFEVVGACCAEGFKNGCRLGFWAAGGAPSAENAPTAEETAPAKKTAHKAAQGGKTAKSVPKWKPERFEKFWAFYRQNVRGEAREKAVKAWDKLKADDDLLDQMGQALLRQMATEEWRRGIGVPYASSWLNGRRWEDTPPPERGGGHSERVKKMTAMSERREGCRRGK